MAKRLSASRDFPILLDRLCKGAVKAVESWMGVRRYPDTIGGSVIGDAALRAGRGKLCEMIENGSAPRAAGPRAR
jgi:hypothetical protein